MADEAKIKAHTRRRNAEAGARPARDFPPDVELPKRTVPLELHPATFAHRLGIKGEAGNPVLDAAQRAFSTLSRTLTELHARERTIRADASKTPQAHALAVAKLVDQNRNAPAGALDAARKALLAEIEGINAEIEKSCRSAMSREDAAELRLVLRGLSPAKRREFFAKAIAEKRFAPLAAALAHPEPIASGMTDAERASLHRNTVSNYETGRYADPRTLDAIRAALESAVVEFTNGERPGRGSGIGHSADTDFRPCVRSGESLTTI